MIKAMCVEKIHNTSGAIVEYRLKDTRNILILVPANDLKAAIKSGKIEVVNLHLTEDNRLIDNKSYSSQPRNTKMAKKTDYNVRCSNLVNDAIGDIIKAHFTIDDWTDGGSNDICLDHKFSKNAGFMIQYFGDDEVYLYGFIPGKNYGSDYMASYKLNKSGMSRLSVQMIEWINYLGKMNH